MLITKARSATTTDTQVLCHQWGISYPVTGMEFLEFNFKEFPMKRFFKYLAFAFFVSIYIAFCIFGLISILTSDLDTGLKLILCLISGFTVFGGLLFGLVRYGDYEAKSEMIKLYGLHNANLMASM